MYSTAILDQVNLYLRTLMRILRFICLHPPHFNENPPQKNGNRGPSPTTDVVCQARIKFWSPKKRHGSDDFYSVNVKNEPEPFYIFIRARTKSRGSPSTGKNGYGAISPIYTPETFLARLA